MNHLLKIDPESNPPPAMNPKKPDQLYYPLGSGICIIVREYKPQTNREILQLNYGVAPTPFGSALLSWCERGICSLTFCNSDPDRQLRKLALKWPAATLHHDPEPAAKLMEAICRPTRKNLTLNLFLQGTKFQINVWRALLQSRPGQTIPYSQLAQMAGSPKAHRAVGSAMAANPIAYLIPCHRVIQKDGSIGNYGGGIRCKQKLLEWETKGEALLAKIGKRNATSVQKNHQIPISQA